MEPQLEGYLRSVAGSARALLERALLVIARQDGPALDGCEGGQPGPTGLTVGRTTSAWATGRVHT